MVAEKVIHGNVMHLVLNRGEYVLRKGEGRFVLFG